MRLLFLSCVVLSVALYVGVPNVFAAAQGKMLAQAGIAPNEWKLNSNEQKGNVATELGKLNLIRADLKTEGDRLAGLPQIVGRIMGYILGFVGILSLGMFTYAGLNWLFSRGNSETVKKSKDIIFWTVVGLIIIFISYIVIQYVLVFLYKAVGA